MSIESEILRIQHNIANAYAAVSEKGGNVPLQPTSQNLAAAIASIPSGGGGIPAGGIISWSGTTDNIPSGWALCDGQNGTPDLRGKFILGSSDDHAVGETGGAEEVALTVAQMPEHSHNVFWANVEGSGGSRSLAVSYATPATSMHTTRTGNSQPHPNMPPYYTLSYIMKLPETPPSPSNIYGAEWDGTATTAWTRTDARLQELP